MPHSAKAPSPSLSPRQLLVADDDASTRQFLAGALTSLGYEVTLAADGAEALALARSRCFDALLLDCRMPHAGASEVLVALRADPAAASRHAVLLATSAEVPAILRVSLLAAGFAGVIEKPCQMASLGHALAATLGIDDGLHLLDDAEGLAATGDADTMRALRALLHHELQELLATLDQLQNQPRDLVERMHRLRSACGFCGTSRLGAQARALQNHVLQTQAVVPPALDRFRQELVATLAALEQP